MVVPAANYEASTTLTKALKQDNLSVNEENIFYPEYRDEKQPNGDKTKVLNRLFYADKFDGQHMKNLTILDWSRQGLNQIITAQSAVWNQEQNIWDFYKGTIYVVAADASYRDIVRFEHQQLRLSRAPLDLASKGHNYDEMNIAQSREYLKIVRMSGDEKKILKLQVRIQQRIAMPFVCVVFGLVGSSLGIRPQRTGKATSFGISIMVIFSYYLLLTVTGVLGQMAVLSPFIAAWFPNFFGLGAGGLLVARASR